MAYDIKAYRPVTDVRVWRSPGEKLKDTSPPVPVVVAPVS